MAEIRFLADENIPASSVKRLRDAGLDVFYVHEKCKGAADREVLTLALEQSRVLLTLDRDFGQLVFKHGIPASCGVVYFRLIPVAPNELADVLLRLLKDGAQLSGMFTVCDKEYVRQRPLLSHAG